MPLTPVDYSKTIIYKIEHNVDKSLVYVGSTTDFKSRKSNHKSDCNNEKGKSYNYKLYVLMRENGGWDEFQMLEIKKYPCNDKREAEAEEERCRVELKANMNAQRAFTSKEEKKEIRDEYNKKYQGEHKEKLKEQKLIYREANKDKSKSYRKANKDKQKEYMNEYSKNNKDKKKEYDKAYREKKRAMQLNPNQVQ